MFFKTVFKLLVSSIFKRNSISISQFKQIFTHLKLFIYIIKRDKFQLDSIAFEMSFVIIVIIQSFSFIVGSARIDIFCVKGDGNSITKLLNVELQW